MLPLWLSPSLGFGSYNSGTAAASPGNCADSPDSVLKDMIGSTCAELKLMGKCDSSDELVASLMLKHCAATCTECIEPRMTYSSGSDTDCSKCEPQCGDIVRAGGEVPCKGKPSRSRMPMCAGN